MKRIILALLMILGAQVCQAAKIFVPTDSATIQAGINGAPEGDTVVVEDGTYTGTGNRDISFYGKDIVVMSLNGAAVTILDLQGIATAPHRAFNFLNNETSAAELVGFTIMNGYGTYFHDNYEGGAMLIENSSPTIKYCVFANNDGAHQGGAVSCFTSSPTFINCTFVGNSATYGGGVYTNGASPILENCIIAFSVEGSAINSYSGGTVDLTCCDLYGNVGGDYVDCAAGQLGVNGNISSDPLFCDVENNDFQVGICSPCGPLMNPGCGLIGALEAGCTGADLPFAYQMSFDPVMDDSLVTSSSFEIFWSYFDTAATSQNSYEIEVGTDNDWSAAEMWSSGEVVSSDTSAVYSGTTLYDDAKYYLRIRVSDGTNWGTWAETRFYSFFDDSIFISEDYLTIQWGIDHASEDDTVFVRDGTYSGYGNWDLDFGGKNIVLRSESGPELTTIQGSTNHRGFHIHSGEDTTSVIDGFTITGFAYMSNGGVGICCRNSDLTIKNCVIGDNISINAFGPGIAAWNANVKHINCTILNNTCPLGWCESNSEYRDGTYEFINCVISNSDTKGTIFINNSDATFTNCTFSDNTSYYFSGALTIRNSNAEIINCLFSNNTAHGDEYPYYDPSGGALGLASCTTLVANCTFVGNYAEKYGDAIYASEGELTIENTIIAYGTHTDPIVCDPAYISNISCTDIYGNAAGDWVGDISAYAGINGNMSLDPMFCDTVNDNYALDILSPCVPSSPENECAVLIGSEPVGCESYVCGDANGDGFVNVSDAVNLLNYIFVSGPPPTVFMSGDANCDGVVNVSDVVHVLNFIFKGGYDPCDTDGDDIPDC